MLCFSKPGPARSPWLLHRLLLRQRHVDRRPSFFTLTTRGFTSFRNRSSGRASSLSVSSLRAASLNLSSWVLGSVIGPISIFDPAGAGTVPSAMALADYHHCDPPGQKDRDLQPFSFCISRGVGGVSSNENGGQRWPYDPDHRSEAFPVARIVAPSHSLEPDFAFHPAPLPRKAGC
jgi:hypothetical protein